MYHRGPYHYSKQYYKNYIKVANRGNFNYMSKVRGAFIPEFKVKKKTFNDRFNAYMDKLKAEEERRGCNVIKEMTKAMHQGDARDDPRAYI